MTSPAAGALWATVDDLPDGVADLHPLPQWDRYLSLATDVLWAATGRRWRGANLTAEAVLRAAPPRAGEGGWAYHRSWGHCACYGGTGILGPIWRDGHRAHHEPASIRLPHSDVTAVDSVTIDGDVFTAWRLDGPYLVRTDGRGWPECHDRSIVTYRYGKEPPLAGVAACAELATEFGRAGSSSPDQQCALPRRLQSVTRQGISFAALDDMAFLSEGLTGLYAVDLFIRSVNPHGRAQAARVWSPDIAAARRTT